MRTCNACSASLPLEAFHRNKSRPLGREYRCKICFNQYQKSRGHDEEVKQYNRGSVTQKYATRIKQPGTVWFGVAEAQRWLYDYRASHPCVVCSESCAECLDFHHLDPSTKDRTYRTLPEFARKGGLDAVKKEIEKCVVLCANCHRKVHAGVIALGLDRSLQDFQ
jgi:hypothetical protein